MLPRMTGMVCGWLESDLSNFLGGAAGRIRIPVPSFLIQHAKGTVLFDTGLHTQLQTDPHARLGAIADVFKVEFRAGEEVAARVKAAGVDPARVDYLVNSHMHFDHVGGNAQIPNATLVVQRREWEATNDEQQVKRNGYNHADFDLGHKLMLVDGEHDLFGDGSVVCVPSYGHTRGHQSLRVRLESGEVVLTSDACYLRRTLDDLHLPPFAYDREAMLEVLRHFRAMEQAGARLFFGHDPGFWLSVSQSPVTIA